MKRFIRRIATGHRRWWRRQEGTTAVEFALIALPFFWLFIGIMELAMVMLLNNGIEQGVETASRLIRTGQVQNQGMDKDDFQRKICEKVMIANNCLTALKLDVRRFPDFSSISNLEDATIDSNGNIILNEQFQPGAPREVVVVRAFYEWKFFTPLIGQLMSKTGRGSILLNAATTFRNEPFSSN